MHFRSNRNVSSTATVHWRAGDEVQGPPVKLTTKLTRKSQLLNQQLRDAAADIPTQTSHHMCYNRYQSRAGTADIGASWAWQKVVTVIAVALRDHVTIQTNSDRDL